MKIQSTSSRLYKRPENRCTSGRPQPCKLNHALGAEKPQREESRAERRKCTREQSRQSELRGLIAVVDETEIQSSDTVTYVLVAVLLMENVKAAQSMCDLVSAPDRIRPFHWKDEGPKNRDGSRQLIREHAVGTHVLAQTTTLGGNEDARAALMTEMLNRLAIGGVDHLIVESRGARHDELDRAVLLDWNRRRGSLRFTYRWRSKKEPLLWFADALAGASREAVANGDREPIAGLQCDRITPRVEWVAPTPGNA